MYSFDNSLRLLLPHLSPTFIMPDIVLPIRRLAKLLPPIYRGGLELRLGKANSRIDLHQFIRSDNNEPKILENHILSSRFLTHAAWSRIAEFCGRWQDAFSPIDYHIEGLWLELETKPVSRPGPIPGIFINLGYEARLKQKATNRLIMVQKAIQLLSGKPITPQMAANINRCCDACSTGSTITHMGLMLSRSSENVRLNVKGISPCGLKTFLAHVGWKGPLKEIEAIYANFHSYVDFIVLCLDVGERIHSPIGLECFLNRQSDKDPRWSTLLEHLVKTGLCAPVMRDALLAWSGRTDPTCSLAPWPDQLIVESLLRQPRQFSLFNRRLNHIKIVYQPESLLEAKGYLWFDHEWVELIGKQPAGPKKEKDEFS